MAITKDDVVGVLQKISLPDGGDLISSDMVRAMQVTENSVRFVIEAPSAEQAAKMGPVRDAAEAAVKSIKGVEAVSIVLTAHGPAPKPAEPPKLKIGGHPTPHEGGPEKVSGVDRIIAIGSGKGGVGKSTVSSNLAVALAKQGRRVGLLDADIYGPSQPRMMGANKAPQSPDGKTMLPVEAHGVKVMSIGLMVDPNQALVWRGPMLMGALQQMISKVDWGELDVLLIDLPPGTGDVQLSLVQRTAINGAIMVSTPQDVALIDARKGIDMFNKTKTPILGLIENMSTYVCPKCGNEEHIFGHGSVEGEAQKLGVPFLGALPIDLETRLAGDSGTPIAAGEGAMAEAYANLAARLVAGGMA